MALLEACYIGFVCWYNLVIDSVLAFGPEGSVFVLAAASLFPSYAIVLFSKYLSERFKTTWYLLSFGLTMLYTLGFWAFTLLLDGVSLAYITLAFLPGFLLFLFLVFPLHLVYRKVMSKYPMLPWYGVAFALCFLGSTVLWAVLILFFGFFSLA